MWSPSPPFNVDCLSFQHFFCLASNIDKAGGGGGEGGCSKEGEVSPLILQLV